MAEKGIFRSHITYYINHETKQNRCPPQGKDLNTEETKMASTSLTIEERQIENIICRFTLTNAPKAWERKRDWESAGRTVLPPAPGRTDSRAAVRGAAWTPVHRDQWCKASAFLNLVCMERGKRVARKWKWKGKEMERKKRKTQFTVHLKITFKLLFK